MPRANRERLALLLFATSLGCGTAHDPPTASNLGRRLAELSGASVDTSYTGVLALITVTPQIVELCTATLIAPNLLLTARHCVSDTSIASLQCRSQPAFFEEPHAPGSLWVNRAAALSGPLGSFGLLALSGGSEEFVPVAQVRVPETEAVCGGDIAALILDGQLAADEFKPLTPRLDETVTNGEGYSAVGFGATPDTGEQGQRRFRQGLFVSCAGPDCQTSTDRESNEFTGGDGVCSGDSGGPAIASDGRIIGVASRSSNCTSSVYSAVPSWRDFIRPIAEEAMLLGDYPAPAWLVEPPPPMPVPPMPVPPMPVPPGTGPIDTDAAEDLPGGDIPSADAAAPIASDVPVPSKPLVNRGGGDGCSLDARLVRGPRAAAPWLWLATCLAALARRKRQLVR